MAILGIDLGLEAIDFVKDSKLGKELEKEIASLRENGSVNTRGLEKIIRKYTRGEIEVEVRHGYEMWIRTHHVPNNHSLINWREDWPWRFKHEIKDVGKVYDIGVDLKRGVFTGKVNDFPFTIGVGKDWINKSSKFTVKETTAVILHEIGHAFSFIEHMKFAYVTNFILGEFAERIVDVHDKELRFNILKDTADALDRPKIVDEEIKNIKTKEEAILVLTNGIVRDRMYYTETSSYMWRNWEALADQHVARHGYALPLATALSKFNKEFRPIGNLVVGVINVLTILYVPWTFLLFLSILPLHSGRDDDSQYDTPTRRLEVIRNQHIAMLNEKWLTSEDKKRIVAEVDKMDKLINEPNDPWVLFAEWVVLRMPITSSRKTRSTNTQKLLEDFAASKLTVAANRLETLKG